MGKKSKVGKPKSRGTHIRSSVHRGLEEKRQFPDDSSRDHGEGHLSDMDVAFDEDEVRRIHS